MADDLYRVEDLKVSFATAHGRVEAVRGVSFAIGRGESVGIVGESGSGKTVVCRALLKLFAPNAQVTGGRILFEDRDVLSMPPEEVERLRGVKAAMIFQNPSTHLDPLQTVGDQVAEGLVAHRGLDWREARTEAVKLLADMKITDPERRARAYPHELSGGMRQRVMIAAALACGPEVLIADEPTTALDVTVQAQVLSLLRDLREKRNLTLVFVSHDLGVISEICDRIIVMRNGEIVEQGPAPRLLTQPEAPYTQALIRAQPSLLPRPKSLDAQAVGTPALAVENLSVTFSQARSLGEWLTRAERHAVRAVRGVSFSVGQGGSLGIVGESGSGKSTIARAIVGLATPSGGSVAIAGAERPEDRPRIVQMVFQDPYLSLNPTFTVFQTLSEPLVQHGLCERREVEARVTKLLEQVELPAEFAGRRSGQLSGGQRQRIGIARALAMDPKILIADEVTSALDVSIQAQILGLFQRLQRELGLTLILISHDLGVVRYLCRDVLVMRHGEVVESGRTGEVFDHPKAEYTRDLIAAIPRIPLAAAA